MKNGLRWTFHVANSLVGGSGLVLAVMIYLMVPADEWSVVNHPWQPFFLHLHVLTAPLMVFVFGVIWVRHVQPKLLSAARDGKVTGLVMLLPTVVMAVSGYLSQVAVEPAWREIWAGLHIVVSLAWLIILALHVAVTLACRRGSAIE